jgi:hypothetical protein
VHYISRRNIKQQKSVRFFENDALIIRRQIFQTKEKTMRIKIIKMSLVFVFGLLGAIPQHAFAQSCLPYLTNQNLNINSMKLVTLNKNGVASSSAFGVSYKEGRKSPSGGKPYAYWTTDNSDAPKDAAKQLFSDRLGGTGTAKNQPFDIAQADLINVIITIEASPLVTVTLRTWGNTKATFRGTCSAGGVIHGSTPDVDYLLFLNQFQIN